LKDSVVCNDFINQEQCASGSGSEMSGLCIWIENKCIDVKTSCSSLTNYGQLTCENGGGDIKCVWVKDECLEVHNSCENIRDKELCESHGVVIDNETKTIISCLYSEDGNCYRKDKACDNYGNEECLEHTELKCIPSDKGCRCV
jgi:hypothetical protein